MSNSENKLTVEEKLLRDIFKRRKNPKKYPLLTEEERQKKRASLKEKIEAVLKCLTYREREIIKMRYGLGDGLTYSLEEAGRVFKLSRERIRQIEAKAVRKLQHPIRKDIKGG